MVKKAGKTFDIKLDGDGWEGSFSVVLRPYIERMELAQEFSTKSEDMSDIEKVKYLAGLVQDNVTKLDVKHVEGDEFKSFEDMEYSKAGTELINQMATVVIQGAPLGNILKVQSKEQQ